MRAEESDQWSVSICGLNCAKCDIYMASHGDEKLRTEIVEWFRTKRDKNIKPEKVRCEGCRRSSDDQWSSDCKMMLCARQKGLQYCFQCIEFPCANVNVFSSDGTPHHKRTVENAKRMKEIGIEAWIAEQERKGQCAFCP